MVYTKNVYAIPAIHGTAYTVAAKKTPQPAIALICTLVLILLQPTFQEDQALLVTANTKNVTVWPATIGTTFMALVDKNVAPITNTPAHLIITTTLLEVPALHVVANTPCADALPATLGTVAVEVVNKNVIILTNTPALIHLQPTSLGA